jgi:hypothetical protein
VKPESAAARYLDHQTALDKALVIDGQDARPPDATIDPNKKTGKIRIEYVDEEDADKAVVWEDFTFDQGKITGWSNPSGPIDKVLWTRRSKDSALGTAARLVSA